MGVIVAPAGTGLGTGPNSEPSLAGKFGVGPLAALSDTPVPERAGVKPAGGEGLKVRGTTRYTLAGPIVGGMVITAGVGDGTGAYTVCAGVRGADSNTTGGEAKSPAAGVAVCSDCSPQATNEQAKTSRPRKIQRFSSDGQRTIPPARVGPWYCGSSSVVQTGVEVSVQPPATAETPLSESFAGWKFPYPGRRPHPGQFHRHPGLSRRESPRHWPGASGRAGHGNHC